MNDNTNNKIFDIKTLVSDGNPAQAVANFIRYKIKEHMLVCNEDNVLYLSAFINRSCKLNWIQLSQLAGDFSNLSTNSISPKMLNDFFGMVELQFNEFKNLESKNCVLVEIEMDLNEIVVFDTNYPIWIFSTKVVKDVINSSNNSNDKYDIKLN